MVWSFFKVLTFWTFMRPTWTDIHACLWMEHCQYNINQTAKMLVASEFIKGSLTIYYSIKIFCYNKYVGKHCFWITFLQWNKSSGNFKVQVFVSLNVKNKTEKMFIEEFPTCDSKTLICTKWHKQKLFLNNSTILMVGKESNKELQLSFEKASPNLLVLAYYFESLEPYSNSGSAP